MIFDKQWFSKFALDCSRFLHDRSPMNDLLLNDQQQLNVGFDYGNLPDVLFILMSVLVLFHQYNTKNSHHKEFYRLQNKADFLWN